MATTPKRLVSMSGFSQSFKGKLSIEELALQHTETAIQTLLSVMQDESETGTARTAAANSLLDRAYGKAMERSVALQFNGTQDTTDYAQLSTRDLIAHALQLSRPATAIESNPVCTTVANSDTPGTDFETGEE